MQNTPLPWHLDVLEQHRGVAFVEARRKRIVELADRVLLIRLARPDADAGRIQRHHAGHRLLLLTGRQRLQVAAPGLVAEYRRGAEHLQPVDDDAAVILADHLQGRRRALLLRGSSAASPADWSPCARRTCRCRALPVSSCGCCRRSPLRMPSNIGGSIASPLDVAREVVRRAAHQAIRPRGDAAMGFEPAHAGRRGCAAGGTRSRSARRSPRSSSRRGSPASASGRRSWRRSARRCGRPDAVVTSSTRSPPT